jgi:PAS domain S-box-containing protein
LAAVTRERRAADIELRWLFDLSLDAFAIAGFDGTLRRVNPAYARILGYTPEELLAKPFMEIVHPDDMSSVTETLGELAEGHDVIGFRCRHLCADGSVRWMEWNTHARPDEGVVYSVGRDITEYRTATDELAALRRVATLVAEGVEPLALIAVVAEEVSRVVNVPIVSVVRYEPDGTATEYGSFSDSGPWFTVGKRWSLDGTNVVREVLATSAPARIDDYEGLEGQIADAVRAGGIRSTVAIPIVVAARLWGAMVVSTTDVHPLPDGTETRLADFTGLLATAIGNAESREALERLADEHDALRRVATLVGQGVGRTEIFSAVTHEVARVFGSDAVGILRFEHDPPGMVVVEQGSMRALSLGTRLPHDDEFVATRVYRTGRSARLDAGDWSTIDDGIRTGSEDYSSGVASPIIVAGSLWGAISVTATEPFAPGTEARLERFTDLVSTAIANAESRGALERLADEQAALQRVAMLVAQDVPPAQIFTAVTEEVDRLFGGYSGVMRFDDDPPAVIFMGLSHGVDVPVGTRWVFEEGMSPAVVYRTGKPARVDRSEWSIDGGPFERAAHRYGMVSSVACPVVVEGRLWGALTVSSFDEPLPLDTEERLMKFTDLVATAIANAQSRDALARLAEEQAALRRAATLIVRGVHASDVFSVVSDEIAQLIGADSAAVLRFEHEPPAIVVVGVRNTTRAVPLGMRSELRDGNATMGVYKTGRSTRIDARAWDGPATPLRETLQRAGLVATVASPITLEGRLWGAVTVSATRPLPHGTEQRLERFGELLSIAIASSESREAVRRLAEEQAALRRVATLVAQDVPPAEIFNAVSNEVAGLLGTDSAYVGRFDPDGPAIVAVGLAKQVTAVSLGARWELADDSMSTAAVYRTGRSARIDGADWSSVNVAVGELARRLRTSCAVSSPIIVQGRLWGAMSVASREPLPADTEERLEKFTDLVATALANAETRSELAASRRRIVEASDDARRRIERNLHDGTQQRLVALGLAVRAVEANVPPSLRDLRVELSEVASGLAGAVSELQEVSRGIHPANLSQRGLGPALRTLARRSSIPVELDLTVEERLPDPVEVAAYYVASEALANAAKHAQASYVDVSLTTRDGNVVLSVGDDGVGGADPLRGSGLVGLRDRVEALGGSIDVRSEPGHGTRIVASLPLAAAEPVEPDVPRDKR